MAKRTMVMYAMRFRERRNTDENSRFDVDDIMSGDLLNIFSDWIASLENGIVPKKNAEDWTRITNHYRVDSDAILLHVETGKGGESGTIIHMPSGEAGAQFDEDDAVTVQARLLLIAPRKCKTAIMCIEHVQHGGGDTRVLAAFAHYFSKTFSDAATMDKAPVLIPGILEQGFKGIDSVDVNAYLSPSDVAAGIVGTDAYIVHSLHHQRNKLFGVGLLNRFFQDPKLPGTLVGLEGKDLDDLKPKDVTIRWVGEDGSRNHFTLDEQAELKVRMVLNDYGEPCLDDAMFISKCRKCCSGYLASIEELEHR